MKDQFKLVSNIKAIKVFKGTDYKGYDSIVFILTNKPDFELKTKKIQSRINMQSDSFHLYISLVEDDETSKEIFDVLIYDLLGSVEKANTETEVFEILANRFQYWMDLFKRTSEHLNESWIKGYVGELWFLNNVLINRLGVDEAIKSWTGPTKSNQDFITKDKIFEIKTCSTSSNTVRISNENQLMIGMFLVILKLNSSSEVSNSSFNLSKLVNEIKHKITNPELLSIFNKKLLDINLFPMEQVIIFDQYSYEIDSMEYYYLSDNFPIIDHSTLPKAILKYSYELSVEAISYLLMDEVKVWS